MAKEPIIIPTLLVPEFDTGSFLVTASAAGNIITFTKGDGSTFDITISTGSGGGVFGAAGQDTWIQYNEGGNFGASGSFIFNDDSMMVLTGSIHTSGSRSLFNSGVQISTSASRQPWLVQMTDSLMTGSDLGDYKARINGQGIFILGAFTTVPTPILGGAYYNGNDNEYYLAFPGGEDELPWLLLNEWHTLYQAPVLLNDQTPHLINYT